jgi:hypothetical protein
MYFVNQDKSDKVYVDQIDKTKNKYKVSTPNEFEYFDMPDVKRISKYLSKADYKIYGWDMKKSKPADNFKKVVSQIDYSLKNHKTKSTNKCVILMHIEFFTLKKTEIN